MGGSESIPEPGLGYQDDLIDITAIIDMSESMKPLQKETVEGFNTFLKQMKKTKGKYIRMSLILFSNQSTVVWNH